MIAVFWLKLDTWPRSAILDLPFIARGPRPVLPTSLTGDVTLKLTRDNRDEAEQFPLLLAISIARNMQYVANFFFFNFLLEICFPYSLLQPVVHCLPFLLQGQGSSHSTPSV